MVHIKGSVSGNQSLIAIFIFGPNYYERKLVSFSDGVYDYKMNIPDSMSTGEYFIVVEHPMYDGRFGVQEIKQDGKTALALVAAGGECSGEDAGFSLISMISIQPCHIRCLHRM